MTFALSHVCRGRWALRTDHNPPLTCDDGPMATRDEFSHQMGLVPIDDR